MYENNISRRDLLIGAGATGLVLAGAAAASTFLPETSLANPTSGKVGTLNCRVYAMTKMNIKKSASSSSTTLCAVSAGKRMWVIDNSNSTWYKVQLKKDGETVKGYVLRSAVLINVCDYDPRILADIVNVEKCVDRTQKWDSTNGYVDYSLSGITGKALYNVYSWATDEAVVTYAMAKKLSAAADAAEDDGYQIKIYDAYRPKDVSDAMSTAMKKAYSNSKVEAACTRWGFGWSWFVAGGTSSHNTATAVDCTLVKSSTGKELSMISNMGDCSTKSVIRKATSSVASKSTTLLKTSEMPRGTDSQKANVVRLNKYMTQSGGLYALKSEWWHFQLASTNDPNGTGAYNFYIHA